MGRVGLVLGVAMLVLGGALPAEAKPERRCGWLVNPTPANWWLRDRDGEWVLSVQGRDPVAGMDEVPDMSTRGWVETNGHYGYGCACLTLETAPGQRVVRVLAAEALPLSRCRADRALPPPG